MNVIMGKVWLYGIVCLCMCLSCARVASDESGEREICFRGNVLELQQVHLLGSRAGLGSGDKVQLYIVEQEEEELKLPASEDFYQMSSDTDGNVPQRLFFENFDEPSTRTLACRRYLSLKL